MSYRFKSTLWNVTTNIVKEELFDSINDARNAVLRAFHQNPNAASFEERKQVDGKTSFATKNRANKIIFQLKQL